MKTILVTGGTVFVSRYIAEYYIAGGYDVYVLNRNSRPQPEGAKLIQADRHDLGDRLRPFHFDVVVDTAYTSRDIVLLLDAMGSCGEYVFISSSAVYPEYCPQPLREETGTGMNKYWGKYGTDKIAAEETLMERKPDAYILRPPYLYGPMNNVYREAFVFDCALMDRPFYIPQKGGMKLQFFYIRDLCRFIDVILQKKPEQHTFNVGNKDTVSVREWVEICYDIVGKQVKFVNVPDSAGQKNYFSFYNYEYYLDVSRQYGLLGETKALGEGLEEAFEWYRCNSDKVGKKPYMDYIDRNLAQASEGGD
ncbi:MAG: NAD-dependent epimerase/dehydratase family protein [Lachnospiraceae bacterium]|nr:NAD-dependent epimerase/dehydratase family protein [Lachnospiraceae bacterium]